MEEIVEISFNRELNDSLFGDSFNEQDMDNKLVQINKVDNNFDIFQQLPRNTKSLLKEYRSITKLFDWQEECLRLPCIYNKGNLIYSSPTGGGKTLISELILIREVVTNKKNAIYVVPFISLAHEKVSSLAPLGCSLGFHVEEYAGSKGTFPPRKRYKRNSIYIATIEKASMLVNSFFEENRINTVGIIVIDELHMINEPRRGVVLEIMLTKLIHKKIDIQIIGMSATLQNVNDICSFLNATYFTSLQRPVSLVEYLAIDYDSYIINSSNPRWKDDMISFKKYEKNQNNCANNLDLLLQFIMELDHTMSILIFCSTKKNCEITAQNIAKHLSANCIKYSERKELLKALEYVSGGVCPILRLIISYGIAYHHAGMPDDERKIIEEAYLCGTINILCCTSTLAAGVNLPAHRVIIKSPYIGSEVLNNVYYRQMIGRAGRPGLSSSGDSILMIEQKHMDTLNTIFENKQICKSALSLLSNSELSTIILSLCFETKNIRKQDLIDFFKSSLLFKQLQQNEIEVFIEKIDGALNILKEEELIFIADTPLSTEIKLTSLGNGVSKSGIEVKEYKLTYNNIKKSLENMFLLTDLHLIFICIPTEFNFAIPNPDSIIRMLSGLTLQEQKLLATTGLNEGVIYKLAINYSAKKLLEPNGIDLFNRWYLTLLIYQMYKGRTVWNISQDFEIPRGILQQLMSSTVSTAGMLARFSKEIECFWHINLLFENMVQKLLMLNSKDVYPLLDISGVKLGRAKQLYNGGYKTIADVASANVNDLLITVSHISRRQASSIISSAKLIIREQVESLREKAEEILDNKLIDLEIR